MTTADADRHAWMPELPPAGGDTFAPGFAVQDPSENQAVPDLDTAPERTRMELPAVSAAMSAPGAVEETDDAPVPPASASTFGPLFGDTLFNAAGGAPVVTGRAPEPQRNGSSVTSVDVAASGDQRIDGILGGTKWSGNISYSDPNAASDYQSGYDSDDDEDGVSAQNEGFSQLSAQELLAVHYALNSAVYTQPSGSVGFSVEGFTKLGIDYLGSGSGKGTIRVANSSDPDTAYAYYPDNGTYGGDVFIGPSADTPTAGNYSWHTMLHELGHALGLKHGHETDGFGALPANVNSIEFSLMTYDDYIGQPAGSGATYETWGGAQTFMMLDIAALQYMYGADYSTNSGNTVYSWSPTGGETYVDGKVAIDPGGNRIFATIWDGGGVDTYDLSNYTTDLDVDLGPGDYSTFSDAQRSYLGGGPNDGYARGNIFNALLYQGNNASLIENATGGSGNDTMDGNDVGNRLTGNGGNDYLYGLGGNDTLLGGAQKDYLSGSSGNDRLDGGSDKDTLHGGTGNDTLLGSTGHDYLSGSTGNDSLLGEGDNDTLHGGDGADTLSGGTGNDRMYGGAGNDTMNGSTGADLLDAGTENDRLDGGTENDTLYGGAGNDTLLGGDGNDTVKWEGGTDHHDGGAATDTILLATNLAVGATFNLSTGKYTYGNFTETWASFENYNGTAASGRETVIGSSAANSISAGGGANLLQGGGGNDTVSGGGGNDTLEGGTGNDTLLGGAGDDIVKWDSGTDYHNGGAGTDTIRLASNLASGAAFDLGAGTYTYGGFTESWIGFENFDGTAATGSEAVTGSAVANRIAAGSGANLLQGAGGNDTLLGGGNDTLDGGTGNDSLVGGAGDDVVKWGSGTDSNDGGTGTDTIFLDVNLTTGTTFNLGTGQYTYGSFTETWANFENYDGSAGTGQETVIGSSGANLISGGLGSNSLSGGAGSDTVNGGAGNDALQGGTGNDTLDGGIGSDTLTGGTGKDFLSGGADADRFVFLAAGDSAVGADRDVIGDWEAGDVIDLEAIDANTLLRGNQDFTFVGLGSADLTVGTGEVKFYQVRDITFVVGNIGIDDQADFQIQIAGLHTLTEANFLGLV